MQLSAVAILIWLMSASPGWAQCMLAVEGDGGSTVMINATGCNGDTIAIVARAEGQEKQFAPMPGPELAQPFNLLPCDLELNTDHTVPLTYTVVVVSGPDKGQRSAPYTGTLDPPPPPSADSPPWVNLSGVPSPGNLVIPGDSIHITATAGDDMGLTYVKVVDPEGKTLLEKQVTPLKRKQVGCHAHPISQTETFTAQPYVVPGSPPSPKLQFTAVARDTAGHETTATAAYLTEAFWNGRMILDGASGAGGNVCTSHFSIELWVKTVGKEEVTGTAEARHTPIQCSIGSWPVPEGSIMPLSITGTFNREGFRLFFTPGGQGSEWAVGLHLLTIPAPSAIELSSMAGDYNYAKGTVKLDNFGNVENKVGSASLTGEAYLSCCFSDPGQPQPPPKPLPRFLGEQD